jgi:hypothetical protein
VGEAVRVQPHVLPCYSLCPHPRTPHPTEQVLSDCRNRHPVTAHKGTHTGPAIRATTLAATLEGRKMPKQAILSFFSRVPGLGGRAVLTLL